jgi:hypothetical protein
MDAAWHPCDAFSLWRHRSSELPGSTRSSGCRERMDTARFAASDPPPAAHRAPSWYVTDGGVLVNNYFRLRAGRRGHGLRARRRSSLPHARHAEVTRDATTWIRDHRDTRFFMFVNHNSPHELLRVPPKCSFGDPSRRFAARPTRLKGSTWPRPGERTTRPSEPAVARRRGPARHHWWTSDHGETMFLCVSSARRRLDHTIRAITTRGR